MGVIFRGCLEGFEVLKQVCMTAPILAFANYTKLFLLETDVSKDGLGAVLLQKQANGCNTTMSPAAAEPSCLMRRTIT